MQIYVVIFQARDFVMEIIPCVKEQNAKASIEMWIRDKFDVNFPSYKEEKVKTYVARFLNFKCRRKDRIKDFDILVYKETIVDI